MPPSQVARDHASERLVENALERAGVEFLPGGGGKGAGGRLAAPDLP